MKQAHEGRFRCTEDIFEVSKCFVHLIDSKIFIFFNLSLACMQSYIHNAFLDSK